VLDAFRRGMYLTMDFWQSRRAYDEFMTGHRAEYTEIDAMGGEMTVGERRVGWFEMSGE
jgi:hypothetical protein